MKEIDPGLFYSNLAQASFIIVALVGALLISRISDHTVFMRGEKNDVVKKIPNVRMALDAVNTRWSDFEKFLKDQIAKDTEAMARGESMRQEGNWFDWTSSGGGTPPQTIKLSQERRVSKRAAQSSRGGKG